MISSSCPTMFCNRQDTKPIQYSPSSVAVFPKSFRLRYCAFEEPTDTSLQPFQSKGPKHKQLNAIGPTLVTAEYDEKGRGSNPILKHGMRGTVLPLDRPHYSANIHYEDIYNPVISRYGRQYTSYTDITGGSVYYWIPDNAGEVFFDPVYINPSIVQHKLVKDPLNNVRPEYTRTPLDFKGCNTFSKDQIEFREDLMARQSRKRDEQDYVMRWGKQL